MKCLASLALLALAVPVARAQTLPLAWEPVGTDTSLLRDVEVEGIAFRHGPDPDGSLDTLYAVHIEGVTRFAPGAEGWEPMCVQSICRTDYMAATKEGYLLIGSEAGPGSDG